MSGHVTLYLGPHVFRFRLAKTAFQVGDHAFECGVILIHPPELGLVLHGYRPAAAAVEDDIELFRGEVLYRLEN